MAIITIDNLNEIQEYGENDTLLINTQNGAKKIKANKLGGGGAEAFYVNISSEDGVNFSMDKTVAEIFEAFNAGGIVIPRLAQTEDEWLVGQLTLVHDEGDEFAFFNLGNNMIIKIEVSLDSGGQEHWSIGAFELNPIS